MMIKCTSCIVSWFWCLLMSSWFRIFTKLARRLIKVATWKWTQQWYQNRWNVTIYNMIYIVTYNHLSIIFKINIIWSKGKLDSRSLKTARHPFWQNWLIFEIKSTKNHHHHHHHICDIAFTTIVIVITIQMRCLLPRYFCCRMGKSVDSLLDLREKSNHVIVSTKPIINLDLKAKQYHHNHHQSHSPGARCPHLQDLSPQGRLKKSFDKNKLKMFSFSPLFLQNKISHIYVFCPIFA